MTNQLGAEPSAYLRSAAHQPIHWWPWGEAAFAAAREDDRPVLLDVGAVWCHWCHVMDHESYDDPALADFLNAHFVCIKVDRDARPDVDARYQRAVQALAGQGGWPLTAFLTPAGDVFFGGTYFPPTGRYGRPSFRTVLEAVLTAWRERRDQVSEQAALVRGALAGHLDETAVGEVSEALLDGAVGQMRALFDPRHGGFGTAPKFPHPTALELLLVRWRDTRDAELRAALRTMLERTLDGMGRGGIHDQLGGGFHRYSTDAEWIVPHFEKMSYDNSELLRTYAAAAAALDRAEYRAVARGVVRWVREVLADPAGGYGTSQDADRGPGDDGDYFTWTLAEAAAVLAPAELEVAAAYYDIGTAGEMHHDPGRNVLYVAEDVERIASRLARPAAAVRATLAAAQRKLRAARDARPAPFVDPTRYTNWNAMLAGALLRAWPVLAGAAADPDALDAGAAAWPRDHALATLGRLRADATDPDAPAGDALAHTPGGVGGLLDDQVHAAAAALDAYEATGDDPWLEWAEALLERVWTDYHDEARGGLFDVARGRGGEGLLPTAAKPVQDAPTPSPQGVAALAAFRLHELTGAPRWRTRGEALVRAVAGRAAELGPYAATCLLAADWMLHPAAHLVVVGAADDPVADALHRRALATWLPRRVVQRVGPDALTRRAWPPALAAMLTQGAGAGEGARAYACVGATCSLPAATLADWEQVLDRC
ncbi:MAG TPA: thioredoxin domain-containing protein [Gemmatimonadales bacterium]|nr:thioredoxin domain-containing protein [Gemmatimonadales bacterium]